MKIVIVVFVSLVVLILGGALLAGPNLTGSLSSFKSTPKGTEVRTMVVDEKARLVEFVAAPGEVEPHSKVEISAQVSAQIDALPVRPGDAVRKGDLVAKLDDTDLKAAFDSASARRDGERFRLQSEQARLTGLLSTLSFARKELERQRTLYDSGDVSGKALDDAEELVRDLEAREDAAKFTISVIESSLAAAQADITRARDGVENTVILAPMDGIVTAVFMEVGEQVLGTFNNVGSRIMTIANLERMILKAQIPESDIAAVKIGQAARIYINAYQDEVFQGRVTLISLQRSMSTDGTGIFEVEVEIDLQGRQIYSGLAANVDVEIEEHAGAVVESQAIVERLVEELPDEVRRDHPLIDRSKRTTTVVYRLVDGKAVCTPVRLGPSDLTHTLVLKGLDAGDEVVIGPYKVLEKLKHDEAIHPELDEEIPTEDAGDDANADEPANGEDTAATGSGGS